MGPKRTDECAPHNAPRADMSSSNEDRDVDTDSDEDARRVHARKRRRDEAIYGSFLDDMPRENRGGLGSNDDDGYDAGRDGRGTGPVMFRSAGGGGGGGLGFVAATETTNASGGGGLGFARATTATTGGGFGGFASGGTMTGEDAMGREEDKDGGDGSDYRTATEETLEDLSDEEDEDLLPSTFGQRCVATTKDDDAREKRRETIAVRARGEECRLTTRCDFIDSRRLVAGAAQRMKMAEEERKAAAARRKAEEKAARARNKDNEDAFAGTSSRRGGGAKSRQAEEIGSFEKHTKGIGLKLLEKMGYKKGEGLGKGASGISRALETQLRPKNMGMGFNNFKENVNDPTRTSKRDEEEDESDDDMDVDEATRARDQAKRAQEQTMWKKRNELRRQKREYKTAEELLAEEDNKAREAGGGAQGGREKLNIIDMRGAHAQVVDANQLHKSRVVSADEDGTLLPELQHNLKLVVDLAESDITKLDGKIRSEKDTLEILRREKVRLNKQADLHDELAERTQSALKLVEEADALSKKCRDRAEFDALTKSWVEIVKQFPKEYYSHRLYRLALAHATPYVRATFKDWDPTIDPTRGLDELKPWKQLLSPDFIPDEFKGLFDEDAFDVLMREPILSRLRPFISSKWDPTKPSEIMGFIEPWSDTLPEALYLELTHALVLPRLQRRVNEWEPTKERVSLHAWFHPWLPLLHKNLKDLYPTIRQKFTIALTEWEASDSSALTLLKPWAKVFEAKDWSSLMRRCITPKLEDSLAMLRIDPSNQSLEPLKNALAWEEMLGPSAFMTLLEQHFFRKWHAALHKWLTTPKVDLDEVAQWYTGWKSVFSDELLSHERMRVQLNLALNMMNQAASGEGVVMPSVAAPQPSAPVRDEPKAHPMDESTMTLKDMIEQFANAHELEFVPNASGRRHDGLTVYTFGGVNVVVDTARESIRASIAGKWVPVSLEQLLEQAQKSKR